MKADSGGIPESAFDLQRLFNAGLRVDSARHRRDHADTLLDLERSRECIHFLLSQHEPVASLGVDREALRVLLSYIQHNDKARMNREVQQFLEGKADET